MEERMDRDDKQGVGSVIKDNGANSDEVSISDGDNSNNNDNNDNRDNRDKENGDITSSEIGDLDGECKQEEQEEPVKQDDSMKSDIRKLGRGRPPKKSDGSANDERMRVIDGEEVIVRPEIKDKLYSLLSLAGLKMRELAIKMDITYQSLNKKLNGHVDFTLGETIMIKHILKLSQQDYDYLFFDIKEDTEA